MSITKYVVAASLLATATFASKRSASAADSQKNTAVLWTSREEYANFVKASVGRGFDPAVKKMYASFGIASPIPGFSFQNNSGRPGFVCEGAAFDPNKNAIEFYIGCDEGAFDRYNSSVTMVGATKKGLEDHLSYLSRHEAAHAYFYEEVMRGKALQWMMPPPDAWSQAALLLLDEGFADYMACKDPAPGNALACKSFSDEMFLKLFEEGGQRYIYEAGRHLLAPILDADFRKGTELIISSPPTKEQLLDLPGYRRTILGMMQK